MKSLVDECLSPVLAHPSAENSREVDEAREFFSGVADKPAPVLTASMMFAIGQLPLCRRLLAKRSLRPSEHFKLEDACGLVTR